MTYQVLARKWRPRSFDEVTGQAHVTTPLRNAIQTDRVPHAVLLTGPRGVGKTTLARILARCLNCEKGPTVEPCGTCTACVEIAGGTSTDVQEIDAASRTSVDDVREIIESIRYAPSPGKHRIYVVDEVHMLSTPAFNALLKTLEEPPPRSLFVFATTNPERIPYTVLSRCQRYDLRRIPTAEVAARLGEVAKAEGLEVSPASLAAIARAGEGSLRDALTLLDQVVAFDGTHVDDARVAELLDLIDTRLLAALAEACVDADAGAALRACRRAWVGGVDAQRLGAALLGTLRDLVVLRIAPDAPELVEGSDADLEALRALAARAEEPRLRRMFRALLKEQEDLAHAPDPFAVLEMAVVRLATLPAGDDVQTLLARLDALERRLRDGGAPGAGGGEPGAAPAGGRGGRRGGSPARGGQRAGEAAEAEPRAGTAPGATAAPAAGAPIPAAGSPVPAAPAAPGMGGPRPGDAAGAEPGPGDAAVAESDPAAEAARGPREPEGWDDTPPPGEPPPEQEVAGPRPLASPPVGTPSPSAAASGAAGGPAPPAPDAPLPVVFDRLRAFAQEENRGLFAALEGGRLRACTEGRVRIALPSRLGRRRLEERRRDLEAVCGRFFGAPVTVELEDAEGEATAPSAPGRTPARPRAPGPDGEAVRRARHDALRHPAVNDALEILGAEILEIRPLGERGERGDPEARP